MSPHLCRFLAVLAAWLLWWACVLLMGIWPGLILYLILLGFVYLTAYALYESI